MGFKEAPADGVIAKAAAKMKSMEQFQPPEWARFVKTGAHKERPPQDPDWWWTRSAAVLRKLGTKGSMGVSLLRKEYGGRKNRGHKPEHKYRAGGAVLRNVLQQLEAAGFVKGDKKEGRKITREGAAFLSEAAKEARKGSK